MIRTGQRNILLFLLTLGLLACGLTACANNVRLTEQAGNHISIGSAYLSSGQYNPAIKEFLEAEKLTPDDPKVHYLLGICYHGKGLDDLAVSEFKRSLALKPGNSEVHNFLGAVYLGKGRWDDAIASFNKALDDILYDTPANPLYNLGRAYYAKGQYDRALNHYRDAAAREPYTVLMPLIERGMGVTWLAKGDTEQALHHLQKSLELAPMLVETQYWLGMCYRKMNRPGDAVKAFQGAAALAPESEFGRKAKEQLKAAVP